MRRAGACGTGLRPSLLCYPAQIAARRPALPARATLLKGRARCAAVPAAAGSAWTTCSMWSGTRGRWHRPPSTWSWVQCPSRRRRRSRAPCACAASPCCTMTGGALLAGHAGTAATVAPVRFVSVHRGGGWVGGRGLARPYMLPVVATRGPAQTPMVPAVPPTHSKSHSAGMPARPALPALPASQRGAQGDWRARAQGGHRG